MRVLVPLVLLAALAGCSDGPARGPDGRLPAVSAADGVSEGETPSRADVIVIGDSVTEQSSEHIVEAMGDREVSAIGLAGYRTDELVPTVRDALDDDLPDVVVFMAGYNDLWQRTDREAPVEEIVLLMSQVDCAIWVLVPTKGPWARGRARDLETRIRTAATEAGVVIEEGWRDAADAGDGREPDAELVSADHVHPTQAGRRRVASVMAAAVDGTCAQPSP